MDLRIVIIIYIFTMISTLIYYLYKIFSENEEKNVAEVEKEYENKNKNKNNIIENTRDKNFKNGILKLTLGFFKKFIIANNAEIIANFISNISGKNLYMAGVIAIIINVYFNVMGYIDMASGVLKMLNIKIFKDKKAIGKYKKIAKIWGIWQGIFLLGIIIIFMFFS